MKYRREGSGRKPRKEERLISCGGTRSRGRVSLRNATDWAPLGQGYEEGYLRACDEDREGHSDAASASAMITRAKIKAGGIQSDAAHAG